MEHACNPSTLKKPRKVDRCELEANKGCMARASLLKTENSQPTGESTRKTLPLCNLKVQISPLPRMNSQTVETSIKSESS